MIMSPPDISSRKLEISSLLTTSAIFLVLINHVLQFTSAMCYTSQSNIVLQRHVISTFFLRYINECYQRCKEETRCQSLNFFMDRRICEINNRTIALAPENKESVIKAAYFENPNRALIGATSEMPAVSCSEIQKSTGNFSGRYWLVDHAKSNVPFMAYCNMTTLVIEDCVAGQCQNGGTCTYLGHQNYQCACPERITGHDCEAKISECSSSPCLNGGICVDQGDSYSCQCKSGYFGANCTDPCKNYMILSDADRNRKFVSSTYKCDHYLTLGWYRFMGAAGSQMANTCTPKNRCNTQATGWLSGPVPTSIGAVLQSTVYFSWNGNCQYFHTTIKVKRCVTFYVYEFQPTGCNYRYCGE